jgi:hypothetical protein
MELDKEIMFKHRKIEQGEIAKIKRYALLESAYCTWFRGCAAVKLQCIAGGGLFEIFCNISEKSQQKLQWFCLLFIQYI